MTPLLWLLLIAAGREPINRLPLTLQMDELHGNEKYCYTGEPFGSDQSVPETIEAGDLMVFGSDCLVLFYETFANDGWGYALVGRSTTLRVSSRLAALVAPS